MADSKAGARYVQDKPEYLVMPKSEKVLKVIRHVIRTEEQAGESSDQMNLKQSEHRNH